jgi:SAM-dependent methyltransferase
VLPKKQKQALCTEGLDALFWGRLVHRRFFHLVNNQETAYFKKSAGVPRVLLEIGAVVSPGFEGFLHTPQDFHVVGLLPGMTSDVAVLSGAVVVALKPPHVPFAAAFDVILFHGGIPLGEAIELQDWIRMLLGCLKPGGRFYFNTPGSYHFFEHQGQPSPHASHTPLSTPYATWFPEPAAAHIFEEWHQIPPAWLENASTAPQQETRLPTNITFHMVIGSYQKSYDFSEEE